MERYVGMDVSLKETSICVVGCRNGVRSKPRVTGCGNASASRRPRSPWHGSWRSSCIACGAMERTSSGQPRRLRLRRNNVQGFRESGSDVPVGTAASARSTEALRCLIEASAFSTLIRQRPPNAIMRRAKPLPRREQWTRQAHRGELDPNP